MHVTDGSLKLVQECCCVMMSPTVASSYRLTWVRISLNKLRSNGTGPLILNIFEINYSQLIQYEILEKLVTCIVNQFFHVVLFFLLNSFFNKAQGTNNLMFNVSFITQKKCIFWTEIEVKKSFLPFFQKKNIQPEVLTLISVHWII